jgi:hypothetical protein
MLQMRPATVPLGKDPENNLIYVLPYLAKAKLDALTPSEEVDLTAPYAPRLCQGHAPGKEMDVVAPRYRGGRHLAIVQEG